MTNRKSNRAVTRHAFTRDEIVIRLRELGVPLWKAEREADAQIVAGMAPPKKRVRKSPRPRGMSVEAVKFRVWCKDNDLPMPEPNFIPWRESHGSMMELDFAWVDEKVALEVQGGIFRPGGGAHTGKGHLRDIKKMNLAHETGWTLLQCVPKDLFNPLTLDMVRRALTERTK